MEKQTDDDMETGIIGQFVGISVSQKRGAFLGVPMMRILVFWSLYWGSLFQETTKSRSGHSTKNLHHCVHLLQSFML